MFTILVRKQDHCNDQIMTRTVTGLVVNIQLLFAILWTKHPHLSQYVHINELFRNCDLTLISPISIIIQTNTQT